jgi:putative transposase
VDYGIFEAAERTDLSLENFLQNEWSPSPVGGWTLGQAGSRKSRSSGFCANKKLARRPLMWCRKHGISSATFYKRKAKYGGLDLSDAKRLKALEDENSKLKKLLAEAMFDNAMLKEIASKRA